MNRGLPSLSQPLPPVCLRIKGDQLPLSPVLEVFDCRGEGAAGGLISKGNAGNMSESAMKATELYLPSLATSLTQKDKTLSSGDLSAEEDWADVLLSTWLRKCISSQQHGLMLSLEKLAKASATRDNKHAIKAI